MGATAVDTEKLAVEVAVEGVALRQYLAQRTLTRLDAVHVFLGEDATMGDIKPHQRQRPASGKHALSGMRVVKHIGFGHRGDVAAFTDRATHHHYALDLVDQPRIEL